jgi:hypothetical protein
MEAEARCRATGNGVGGRTAIKHGGCGQPGRPEQREQEGGRRIELKTEQEREKPCRQRVRGCTHHEHRAQAQAVSDHGRHFFCASKKTYNAQQCPQLAKGPGGGER